MKTIDDNFWENGFLDHEYWEDSKSIASRSYTCANCHNDVASVKGWSYSKTIFDRRVSITEHEITAKIYICPHCGFPTYFDYNDRQIPQGRKVIQLENVSPEIKSIYFEMVSGYIHHNYTSCLLLGRKLLMHIAVAQFGAKLKQKFVVYVEHLKGKPEISSNLHYALEQIKDMGNIQNHETIQKVEMEDADLVIKLVEGVLQNLFTYPKVKDKNFKDL
jgi:DNA-directed RNA polymerase subunit RPC12/RpoP